MSNLDDKFNAGLEEIKTCFVVAQAMAKNSFKIGLERDGLREELADYKEGCEGLKLTIQDLRPFAECYQHVCETLGIEKDILGYIENLTKQRDDLLAACKDLINANAYAKQVSLRDEPPRGSVWGGVRSSLASARINAQVIIRKIESKAACDKET